MMVPGFAGPPVQPGMSPDRINPSLIEAVHSAIRLHPHPAAKSTYGKILAQLLGEQVRAHAAGPSTGVPGGLHPDEPAGPVGGPPQLIGPPVQDALPVAHLPGVGGPQGEGQTSPPLNFGAHGFGSLVAQHQSPPFDPRQAILRVLAGRA